MLERITTRSLIFGAVPAVAALLCACHRAPEPPAAPALEAFATTRQIMLGITIPTSDVVWQVGAKAPEDDAAWEKVQANAAALAESALLLTVGSRLQDREDWLKYCEALRQSAQAAAAAAQAKNVDAVLEAGDQIYEACDSCHAKYMAARAGEQSQE